MRYTDLMRMEEMSFEEKVIELFLKFPYHQEYCDELFKSIQSSPERGIKISSFHSVIYWVEIYVEELGTFKKHFEKDNVNGIYGMYRVSFAEKDDHGTGTESCAFLKDEVNEICKKALPFMISQGEDKKLIPLLINVFPEFAKYALEYQP